MLYIFTSDFKKEEDSIYTFKTAVEQREVLKAQYSTETDIKVYHKGDFKMTVGEFVNNLKDGDILASFGIETMFNHPGVAYIAFNEMVKSGKDIQVDLWGLDDIGHFNAKTAENDENYKRLMRLIKLDIKRVELLKTELEKEGLNFGEINYVFLNGCNIRKKETIAKCLKIFDDIKKFGMEAIAHKSDNMNKIVNMFFGLV